MRRFITAGFVVAVSISFVEGMTRGFFATGPGALLATSTAQSDNAAAPQPAPAIAPYQGPALAEGVRWNDDGYVEGLAATLGYQSPELMMTGSLRPSPDVAQR